MIRRVLVWPWHGLWSDGSITLSNATTRPYKVPSLQVSALSGPGDTHLFETAVPPITEEETALAPPGGEWWAGRALISGGYLYGMPLSGWLYRAPAGECWSISLASVEVLASTTTGSLIARQYGQFFKAPQSVEVTFVLDAGKASSAEAVKVFADLRYPANGVLRLHSISKTGRHAVLALMTYQNLSGNPDRNPRAYRYYLAEIIGDGSDEAPIAMTISTLYGITDIRPEQVYDQPGGFASTSGGGRGAEISRAPYYVSGSLAGYDVTYNFDPTYEVVPSASGAYTVPGTYRTTDKWMIMVRFDGETPVPVYVKSVMESIVPAPSLTLETITPQVWREPLTGTPTKTANGSSQVSGSVTVSGTLDVTLEGAAESWTRRYTSSVESTVSGSLVSNAYTVDGLTESIGGLPLPKMGPRIGGSLAGDSMTRQPIITIGTNDQPGSVVFSLRLEVSSNNLLGLALKRASSDGDYIGGLTCDGFFAASGIYSSTDMVRYGSYDPAVKRITVGSSQPTGWV